MLKGFAERVGWAKITPAKEDCSFGHAEAVLHNRRKSLDSQGLGTLARGLPIAFHGAFVF